MFSGWGVRTLSQDDHGFNPIGYHLGTVWPHDNSLIAAGLARYGFREEANRIAMALLEAASFSAYRLPEAFSGYDRRIGRFPVPYPTACSPQAWATGAPLLLLRTMLGLDARDGKVTIDPHLPDEIEPGLHRSPARVRSRCGTSRPSARRASAALGLAGSTDVVMERRHSWTSTIDGVDHRIEVIYHALTGWMEIEVDGVRQARGWREWQTVVGGANLSCTIDSHRVDARVTQPFGAQDYSFALRIDGELQPGSDPQPEPRS